MIRTHCIILFLSYYAYLRHPNDVMFVCSTQLRRLVITSHFQVEAVKVAAIAARNTTAWSDSQTEQQSQDAQNLKSLIKRTPSAKRKQVTLRMW